MASRFEQVLHQTRQNIHALKEETKKQEHCPRNDLLNVLLVFDLQRISVTRCLYQISHNMFLKGYPLEAKAAPKN